MFEAIPNTISHLVEWGIYGFLLLLPISLGIPIGGYIWVRSKFKQGACRGMYEHCVTTQSAIIMKEARTLVDTVRCGVTKAYADELTLYAAANPKVYTKDQVEQHKIIIKVIVDSSFIILERKIDDSVKNNHWPRSGTNAWNHYIDTFFEFIWVDTWEYFNRAFDTFHLLIGTERRVQQMMKYDDMKAVFVKFMLFAEDIKQKY